MRVFGADLVHNSGFEAREKEGREKGESIVPGVDEEIAAYEAGNEGLRKPDPESKVPLDVCVFLVALIFGFVIDGGCRWSICLRG
jgi:hypothetical protein